MKAAPRHRAFLGHMKRILRRAGVSADQVAVGGSGYLGAIGLKDTGDLDVWATREAFARLSRAGGRAGTAASGSPKIEFRTPMGEIEFFTGPWMVGDRDFSGTRDTEIFDGVRHWSRARTVAWKRAMGRDKERRDLMLMKSAAWRVGAGDGMRKSSSAKGLLAPLAIFGATGALAGAMAAGKDRRGRGAASGAVGGAVGLPGAIASNLFFHGGSGGLNKGSIIGGLAAAAAGGAATGALTRLTPAKKKDGR